MQFSDLGLSEKVLQSVQAAGYTTPTPIQEQAIPHVLERRDVMGIAQTGTGKTAAFTLPMLSMLETGRARARMPRTLVLEPTRELAAQVEENFNLLGVQHNLSVALLIGGVSFGDQDAKITRGVDVLIATPGRLLDHFERGKLLLSGVELLIIDEADRMLDMGFIPDIERIIKLVPFQRQTLFFSATMPPEIQELADRFLSNPVRVEVAPSATTADTIVQRLVAVSKEPAEKREALREILRNSPDLTNAIIFCNRKRDVSILHRSLRKHGFNSVELHGDMDQRARIAALDAFRSGQATFLVASNVAARGLDIPDVSHVINYDISNHAEDYVHRIGRTGRAGRTGYSITLVAPGDEKYLAAIENLIGQDVRWDGPTLAEFRKAGGGGASQSRRDLRSDRGERGERRGGRKRPGHSDERRTGQTDERRTGHSEERRGELVDEHAVAPAPSRTRNKKSREDRAALPPTTDTPAEQPDRKHRPRRHEPEEPDHSVVGFGSHIPAFMRIDPLRR
ncbi:MAG: DEAD/DEAH box helicase [Methylobacteriaceae bacterium]|jgi:superfamily II DNA/RNA helicase|nr:DEAD/DEAH box helicase [Methylobacteriaceae bacterium]